MAFTVRIFGYRGMFQTPILIPAQDSKDSVFLLSQPYEFAASAPSNGLVAVTLGPTVVTPDLSKILRVEVPDGQTIRYEVSPPGQARVASATSPALSGYQHIMWGAGFALSFIDATGT
jgi:hypothetical protein